MKTRLIIIMVLWLFSPACKKDSSLQTPGSSAIHSSIAFNINYEVDGEALLFDTLLYTTDAGFKYSVSSLKYYLSDISLIKKDSSRIKILDFHYTDAALTVKNQFSISDIPNANYIGICFNIGLDSARNVPGGLPGISENNNMEWPVPMGGGYHFMKFEGDYIDTLNHTAGFTMHLGTNDCLVKIKPLYRNFSINNNSVTLSLAMNLNEWFRNPAIYDFKMDGASSMGSMMAMQKLAANGADVFRYKD